MQYSETLQLDEILRQVYLLRLAALACDEVVSSVGIVKLGKESLAYAGAFLVDGVLGGVGDVAYAPLYVFLDLAVAHLLVYAEQFIIIVRQMLEQDALGMFEEKQIHGLGKRRHDNLNVVVVGKEDSEIPVNDKAAHGGPLLDELVQQAELETSFAQFVDPVLYLFHQFGILRLHIHI